ncbi:MAG: GAF domain-containing protein [Anaerolineae bacterium]|nr:GAF domain-containing protein [Anaerolineae bacterium]
MRILLVEKENDAYQALDRALNKDASYEITWVPRGEDAVELLQTETFDLVLLGSDLPDGHSLEILRQMVTLNFVVPIIILVEAGAEMMAVKALELGAQDYLVKDQAEGYLTLLPAVINRAWQQWQEQLADKQLQIVLKEFQEKYYAPINVMGDVVYVVDTDLRIVLFNTAFRQWNEALGLETDALGRSIFEIFPFLPNQVRDEYRQVFESGELLTTRERYEVGGREVFVETRKIPIVKNGQINRVVTASQEITEQVKVEEALRASREYARSIIESSLDIIVTADLERRIVEFNQAAQQAFGYTLEEVVGAHVGLLYADPDEGLFVHQQTLENGQCTQEVLNKRKNGQVFPVYLSASALRDAHGEIIGVMGVARDVSEWRQAEELWQKHAAQLEILREVSLELTAQLDFDKLLHSIVSQAMELVGGTASGLYLYQPEQDVLELKMIQGSDMPPPGTVLRRGEGLTGKVWETGETLLVDNYQDREGHTSYPWTAVISVPICWRAGSTAEELLGVLDVLAGPPHTFSKSDAHLLSLFATQAAIAIRNVRRYAIEQDQRQAADTLRQVALALTTALHQEEVIERILAQLQRVVPYDTCSVQLLRQNSEDDMELLEIVGGRGFPNLPEIVGISFVVGGDNPNSEVVRTRSTIIVDDAPAKYGDFRREPHAQAGIRAWLGVPMLVGKRLSGMIALDKKEPGFYTPEHARLAEVFAAQAAVAIENAQLYEAERRWATQLAVVNQVARKAVSILDPAQLLQEIVSAIQQGFGYHNVILLLFDEKTNQLGHQAMAGGFMDIARSDYQQPVGEGLIGLAAQTGQSILVNNVHQDSRYVAGFQKEVPTQAELCVPLKLDHQVIGVLDVQEIEVDAFDQTDITAMETLADQIAVAIQNARLYEQAQQDAETRAILLSEVNHRVKNNLTGIIGLLYVARSRAQVDNQATYQTTMDELIGRVRGLASVHSMLSESEWRPLRLSDLVTEIIHAALRTIPYDKRVSINVPASPVRVTSDQAHNLALVVNELATNTIKYALEGRDAAQITFQIDSDQRMVRCEYRDDGPGYPQDVLRWEKHSVGFDLIKNIVSDNLQGEISLHNDNGAVAIIQFRAEIT